MKIYAKEVILLIESYGKHISSNSYFL